MVTPVTLAQLSDIHFGRDVDLEQVAVIERVIADLRPDAVVLAGDLTQRARHGELQRALVFAQTLQQTAPVLVIPGNHDVEWWRSPLGLLGRDRRYRKYRLYFGAELSPDCTPYEAGLAHTVRPERRKPPERLAKRILTFTFPATELFAWGGEPIVRNGTPVGELSSVGYSATLSSMVGMGFVHCEDIEGSYAIEVSGHVVPATASLEAPWAVRRTQALRLK